MMSDCGNEMYKSLYTDESACDDSLGGIATGTWKGRLGAND